MKIIKEKDKKDKMLRNTIIIISCFLVFFVVSIAVNQCDFFKIKIEPEGLCLTFVGILATFVVVSNYAQVKRIEDEINEKIGNLEKEITDIKKIKKDIEESQYGLELKIYEIGERLTKSTDWGDAKGIIHEFEKFSNFGNNSLNIKILDIIASNIYSLIRISTLSNLSSTIFFVIIGLFNRNTNSEEEIKIICNIVNNIGNDLTREIFRCKKIAPALDSLLLFKHTNKIATEYNISEIKDNINMLLSNICNNKKFEHDAQKLIKIYQDDMINEPYDLSLPIINDQELRERIHREEEERKMMKEK